LGLVDRGFIDGSELLGAGDCGTFLGIKAEARFLGNQDFDRYKKKGSGNAEFG
jgi:hypothetical protein